MKFHKIFEFAPNIQYSSKCVHFVSEKRNNCKHNFQFSTIVTNEADFKIQRNNADSKLAGSSGRSCL